MFKKVQRVRVVIIFTVTFYLCRHNNSSIFWYIVVCTNNFKTLRVKIFVFSISALAVFPSRYSYMNGNKNTLQVEPNDIIYKKKFWRIFFLPIYRLTCELRGYQRKRTEKNCHKFRPNFMNKNE